MVPHEHLGQGKMVGKTVRRQGRGLKGADVIDVKKSGQPHTDQYVENTGFPVGPDVRQPPERPGQYGTAPAHDAGSPPQGKRQANPQHGRDDRLVKQAQVSQGENDIADEIQPHDLGIKYVLRLIFEIQAKHLQDGGPVDKSQHIQEKKGEYIGKYVEHRIFGQPAVMTMRGFSRAASRLDRSGGGNPGLKQVRYIFTDKIYKAAGQVSDPGGSEKSIQYDQQPEQVKISQDIQNIFRLFGHTQSQFRLLTSRFPENKRSGTRGAGSGRREGKNFSPTTARRTGLSTFLP